MDVQTVPQRCSYYNQSITHSLTNLIDPSSAARLPAKKHGLCQHMYCMRWQLKICFARVGSSPVLLWQQKRPLHFSADISIGERSISICQLRPTLASRDWKVTDFSAQLRGKNPNQLNFICTVYSRNPESIPRPPPRTSNRGVDNAFNSRSRLLHLMAACAFIHSRNMHK